MAIELLVFQEKNYGRGCQERHMGMMVPVQFFYDFEPEGGFAKIITQARLYCLKESLKDDDSPKPENRNMRYIYLSKELNDSKRSQFRNMTELAGAKVVDKKELLILIYPGQVSKPDHEH